MYLGNLVSRRIFDYILYGILAIIAIVVVFMLWKLFWLFFPLMHGGAPFVPSTWDRIAAMLRLAEALQAGAQLPALPPPDEAEKPSP